MRQIWQRLLNHGDKSGLALATLQTDVEVLRAHYVLHISKAIAALPPKGSKACGFPGCKRNSGMKTIKHGDMAVTLCEEHLAKATAEILRCNNAWKPDMPGFKRTLAPLLRNWNSAQRVCTICEGPAPR